MEQQEKIDHAVIREAEYVCLTVDAIAGSLAQEAAAPSNETDCCNKDWAGASAEDIVCSRREKEGGEEESARNKGRRKRERVRSVLDEVCLVDLMELRPG